jgi:hypothetical protein
VDWSRLIKARRSARTVMATANLRSRARARAVMDERLGASAQVQAIQGMTGSFPFLSAAG